MDQPIQIDSTSMGDPTTYRTLDDLEAAFAALPTAPRNAGHVALLVRRGPGGVREAPRSIRLTTNGGVPGDSWGRQSSRNPEMQIAVMQMGVADMLANGQSPLLFGDSLFLDLDLSVANLPTGSRLRIGEALVEVTPMPHNGCRKFRGRFGPDALRFVSQPALRDRRLRGIYIRVIADGMVACGDPVEVLSR